MPLFRRDAPPAEPTIDEVRDIVDRFLAARGGTAGPLEVAVLLKAVPLPTRPQRLGWQPTTYGEVLFWEAVDALEPLVAPPPVELTDEERAERAAAERADADAEQAFYAEELPALRAKLREDAELDRLLDSLAVQKATIDEVTWKKMRVRGRERQRLARERMGEVAWANKESNIGQAW